MKKLMFLALIAFGVNVNASENSSKKVFKLGNSDNTWNSAKYEYFAGFYNNTNEFAEVEIVEHTLINGSEYCEHSRYLAKPYTQYMFKKNMYCASIYVKSAKTYILDLAYLLRECPKLYVNCDEAKEFVIKNIFIKSNL